MTNDITRRLTSFWIGTKQINLAELERYYYGSQSIDDNGMITPDQQLKDDVKRAFKPIAYSAAVVDEPVGYLASGRFRVSTDSPKVQAWADSYFNRRIRPRLDDLVRWQALYGEAFLYLWTDREGISRGLKVDVIPPIEGGKARITADYGTQDDEELTGAILYKRVPMESGNKFWEYRITLTLDRVKVERREISGESITGAYERWELVSDEPNPAHSLPVVPFFNPTPSDILNMIPIQDDLDKLHLDLRLARAYYGNPTWATDSPDVSELEVGPGRILFGGQFQQFPLPSLSPLLEERDMLLESAAKITKSLVLLSEMGQAPSGIALQYRQQAFLERLHGKAQRLESGLELTLMTAARLIATGADLHALEMAPLALKDRPSIQELQAAEFAVTLEPNIPADVLGNAQIAALWLNELGVSQETALGKAGVEDPAGEVERARKERDAAMGYDRPEPGQLDEDDT